MRFLVILALLLALLVTIFAVQNSAAAPVTFLFWRVNGSLALVLMLTLALGVLILPFPALALFWARRVSVPSADAPALGNSTLKVAEDAALFVLIELAPAFGVLLHNVIAGGRVEVLPFAGD